MKKLLEKKFEVLHKKNHASMGKLISKLAKHIAWRGEAEIHKRGHIKLRWGHVPILGNTSLKGSNMMTIAKFVGITKQAISKSVKELESAGYVERLAHKTDNRSWNVKLTESGASFYTDLSECNNMLEKEMMDIIGKKRLEEMRASLFEIVNHLEEKRKVNLGS